MSFYINFLACSEVEIWIEITSLRSVDVQLTTQPITYPHFTVNISVRFTYAVPLLPELQLFDEIHLDCVQFVQSLAPNTTLYSLQVVGYSKLSPINRIFVVSLYNEVTLVVISRSMHVFCLVSRTWLLRSARPPFIWSKGLCRL